MAQIPAKTLAAWQFFQQMLADVTKIITEDAETEREFFTTLNTAAEGRTLLLIVHRLTGAERLDRIWRLSAGRAVAAAG